jgi:hypothetical protein
MTCQESNQSRMLEELPMISHKSLLSRRNNYLAVPALALAAALSFGMAGPSALAAPGDGQNWGGGSKGGQNRGGDGSKGSDQNWGDGGSKGGGQNWGGGGSKGSDQNWKESGSKGGGQNWGGGGQKGGNWNQGGNQNWKGGNQNWSKNDKNWKGNKGWDGNKSWSQNYNKNWGKGWSNYNNHWNKNWNKKAYVRNWGWRPYYGQFVAGIVLGSLLTAPGAGIVPYAPEPYLCWYWADPYMYRGYWDYCYY